MRYNFVNEIEISYKPRLDINQLQKVGTDIETAQFLRNIWTDDIEFRERFYAIYLNRNNKILGYFIVSIGGCSSTVVDTKMVFQPALNLHATSIILAHNHPSGNLNPSEQDLTLTKRLVSAGKLLDFKILDHIILTVDKHYSFAMNGKIT